MATSIAELREIVARNSVLMGEVAESHKKTEAAIEKLANQLAEGQKKAELDLQETRRVMRETFDDLHKKGEETDRRINRLTDEIGGVGRSLGKTVELVVLPGLRKRMNELGHDFTTASPGKKFFPKGSMDDDDNFAEIDLFLENGKEVLAVEVKTRFRDRDVAKFVNRLKLIRENEVEAGVVGKTIIAAAAGMAFNDDARELAIENGFYIIDVIEDCDNDRIEVKEPEGRIGTW